MANRKPVKVTVKSVITEGIKKGNTIERILKDVASKCPTSVADESHIKFYSGQLKRAGDITEDQHAKYVAKKPAAKKPAAKKPAAKKPAAKKPAAKKPAAKKPAEKKVRSKRRSTKK